MFNFFDEIAGDYGLEIGSGNSFNLVNMSNKLIYIEGHKGIISISDETITFRVKKGAICVVGKKLYLKRITKSTLTICGEIKQIESY